MLEEWVRRAGLSVSVMRLSQLEGKLRIDAEYWLPLYLENEALLDQAGNKFTVIHLSKLVKKVTGSAFYPSIADYYSSTKGMPFIRVADLGDFFVRQEQLIRVPEEIIGDMRQIVKVKEGDIVLAKGGTIGGVSLIQKGLSNCATCRDVIVLKTDPRKINSVYLTTFLLSRFGALQFERYKSQQVQAHLTFPAVENMRIVVPDQDKQGQVAKLVETASEFYKHSEQFYAEAEHLLSAELGLDRLDLSESLFNVRQASDVLNTSRLDAEHYRQKYYRVIECLENIGAKEIVPLQQIVTTLVNGHTPLHHDLDVGDIPFLTAEHVYDFWLDYDNARRIWKKHHEGEIKRTRLRQNDILITIKGRVGNAAVVEHLPGEVNINQDVALLRLKPGIHPYYVVGFLNSPAGKTLMEQIATGQINPFLGLGNLSKVRIPIFDEQKMKAIGENIQAVVTRGHQAKQDAKRLLLEAKTEIERLIERTELPG